MERRKFVRIPTHFPARIRPLSSKRTWQAVCKNLSEGGLFLETTSCNKLKTNDKLIVEVIWSQQKPCLKAVARIAWVKEEIGVGTEFLRIHHKEKDRLKSVVEEKLKSKPFSRQKLFRGIVNITSTFRLLIITFRDFFLRILPAPIVKLITDQRDFAFIIHPRDLEDVARKYPFAMYLPDKVVSWWMRYLWPITCSKITGPKTKTGKYMKGWMVGCPLTAEQMMRNRDLGKKRIIQTAQLAEKLGAKVIGLGAFSSIVTHDGKDLIGKTKAIVTTGNTYSALAAVENLSRAYRFMGLNPKESVVAVVGAGGSVGSGCSRFLAGKVKKLLLVEKNIGALNEVLLKIGKTATEIRIFTKIDPILEADGVIVVTNTPGAILHPHHLKPGAIVIDCAQPSNVSEDVLAEREDVLVIESAIAFVPELDCHFNLGLHPEEVFGCLGEVLIICYSKWKTHHVLGKVEPHLIEEVSLKAEELGIKVAEFRNPLGIINGNDIEKAKKSIYDVKLPYRIR